MTTRMVPLKLAHAAENVAQGVKDTAERVADRASDVIDSSALAASSVTNVIRTVTLIDIFTDSLRSVLWIKLHSMEKIIYS